MCPKTWKRRQKDLIFDQTWHLTQGANFPLTIFHGEMEMRDSIGKWRNSLVLSPFYPSVLSQDSLMRINQGNIWIFLNCEQLMGGCQNWSRRSGPQNLDQIWTKSGHHWNGFLKTGAKIPDKILHPRTRDSLLKIVVNKRVCERSCTVAPTKSPNHGTHWPPTSLIALQPCLLRCPSLVSCRHHLSHRATASLVVPHLTHAGWLLHYRLSCRATAFPVVQPL